VHHGLGGLTVADVLAAGGIRSVFQPIVDLASGDVVAHEALARGPVGQLQAPDALFAAARAEGVLAELDDACRVSAFSAASRLGLLAPDTVFVNVEPEVLDGAPLTNLLAIAESAPGELRIVLEITERALASRPSELLRTVERVREAGWRVALDDVGAEAASLAFMSLLRPDVVKLDLALVQQRPTLAVAEIMNAVNAYAERSGALILAEGIETPDHVSVAEGLGATLGQGWLFGRPTESPQAVRSGRALDLTVDQSAVWRPSTGSPFGCLRDGFTLRRASKRLLIQFSHQLEAQAQRLGEACVVASTFQYARHFTPDTAQRYAALVEAAGFVVVIGEGLPEEPVPGLRGASLAGNDPVLGEWDIVVLSPHFSAALLAHDLGDTGPDLDRRFAYALTYDRPTVIRAARELLSRVAPRLPGVAGLSAAARLPSPAAAPVAQTLQVGRTGR
jgi:EAL domain-containing protein (putative c-di-GMP-specific phosphodiesterase class I)